MWLLIVFTLFLSVKADPGKAIKSAVLINIDEQKQCDVHTTKIYHPLEGKELTVTVNSSLDLTNASCHFIQNDDEFLDRNNVDKNESHGVKLYNFKIKDASDTFFAPQWRCSFYCKENKNIKCAECIFTHNSVHLDMAPTVAINGKEITPKLEKNTSEIYDRLGYYDFYDGEPVNIVCSKNTKFTLIFNNVYMRSNFVIANITLPAAEFGSGVKTMYVLMSRDHDMRYVDCRSSNRDNNTHFITRITFRHQTNLKEFAGFRVNDLKIIKKMTNNPLLFEYQYYNGEDVNVSPYFHDRSNFVCNETTLNGDKTLIGFKNWQYTLKSDELNKHNIHCHYEEDKNISLIFSPIEETSDPNKVIIKGLPFSSILAKYIRNVNTQVIFASAATTLNLTCSDCSDFAPGNDVKTIEKEENLAPNIYVNSTPYYLYNNYNQTFVTFKKANYTTTLYLIDPRIMRHEKEETETIFQTNQSDLSGNSKTILTRYTTLIVVCATVVIILAVCCIIYARMRKRKQKNVNSVENECALSDNREVSVPTQWTNYINPVDAQECSEYSEPYKPETVQEMYATPVPKSQRNKPEISPYAEVIPKNTHGLNPHSISNQILRAHAKVVKNQVKTEKPYAVTTQSESPYAVVKEGSESPYAEVKEASESPYAEVKEASESPYAVIAQSESPYAEVKASSESPYAVTSQSDYSCAGTSYNYSNSGYEEAKCNCKKKNLNDCNSNENLTDSNSNEYAHYKYCNVFRKGGYVNGGYLDGPKPDYVEPAYFTKNE